MGAAKTTELCVCILVSEGYLWAGRAALNEEVTPAHFSQRLSSLRERYTSKETQSFLTCPISALAEQQQGNRAEQVSRGLMLQDFDEASLTCLL